MDPRVKPAGDERAEWVSGSISSPIVGAARCTSASPMISCVGPLSTGKASYQASPNAMELRCWFTMSATTRPPLHPAGKEHQALAARVEDRSHSLNESGLA